MAFSNSCLKVACSWQKADLLGRSMWGVRRNEARANETSQTLGGSNFKHMNLGRESLIRSWHLEEKLDFRHWARGGRSSSGSPSIILIHKDEVQNVKLILWNCATRPRVGKFFVRALSASVFGNPVICLFFCDHVIPVLFNLDFGLWPSDNYELWRSRINSVCSKQRQKIRNKHIHYLKKCFVHSFSAGTVMILPRRLYAVNLYQA